MISIAPKLCKPSPKQENGSVEGSANSAPIESVGVGGSSCWHVSVSELGGYAPIDGCLPMFRVRMLLRCRYHPIPPRLPVGPDPDFNSSSSTRSTVVQNADRPSVAKVDTLHRGM